MASLKLASASISSAERDFTRRANSPSERTYRLSSPLVTQSRSAATYSSPSMTSGLPPNTSVRLVVHAGSAGRTIRPRSSIQTPFFFKDTATTEIYTLSLHDALPIFPPDHEVYAALEATPFDPVKVVIVGQEDRKSTRLNSSHEWISYAVFCLQK